MRDITVAITEASYSGNKGAAAMLQSSIKQLYKIYGEKLVVNLMSVFPSEDKEQIPYDFINVVPAKPQQVIFVAFPLAILYWIFRWFAPVKALLKKNKIIKTYLQTDIVIDEAGVSFVDSRGIVMNTYVFICAAIPMLLGVDVVRYSQALGTFKNPINRIEAKIILPKMKLICARGEKTLNNLHSIGIKDNVVVCADGAFTMPDDEEIKKSVDLVCESDDFYSESVVGLSISSVVEKKCRKKGIDYIGIMGEFIDYLNSLGYNVLIIANAARINSVKPRCNDLCVCDQVYNKVSDKAKVRWYYKEMDAEEIREYISHCRFVVASRFHAMIGALEKKVPVLLIGWSHKYQEVLDMFELGNYSADFSNLSLADLKKNFEIFVGDEQKIHEKLDKNFDSVIESSYKNIELISDIISKTISGKKNKTKYIDYSQPSLYCGDYLALRKGYSKNSEIRNNAASGGVVTNLLCSLLENGEIDGAWVTKMIFEEGKPAYKTFIATTKEEIIDASSSVYMNVPLLKHIDVLEKFDGKVAVVMTPCMLQGLCSILEKNENLRNKVAVKLGLYCSGTTHENATNLALKKAGIDCTNAKRLYYRRGLWRGQAAVIFDDNTEKHFSYSKLFCAYKNAYFFSKQSCMNCKDHFAQYADISFGDIWLKEMKKENIKHTGFVIRTQRGLDIINRMVEQDEIVSKHMSGRDILRSQKRALAFKFGQKWNHKLARKLAAFNCRFSTDNFKMLSAIPSRLIYLYMCFIRVLLNF